MLLSTRRRANSCPFVLCPQMWIQSNSSHVFQILHIKLYTISRNSLILNTMTQIFFVKFKNASLQQVLHICVMYVNQENRNVRLRLYLGILARVKTHETWLQVIATTTTTGTVNWLTCPKCTLACEGPRQCCRKFQMHKHANIDKAMSSSKFDPKHIFILNLR